MKMARALFCLDNLTYLVMERFCLSSLYYQTIQWPQLDVKSEETFNMPPGDSAGPGKVTEVIELPSQCFSPETLPNMDDICDIVNYSRASVQRGLTRFSAQHVPNDSAANLNINLAPQSRSPYCGERKTTPTIHPCVTSKETQTVSSSHQVRFLSPKLPRR